MATHVLPKDAPRKPQLVPKQDNDWTKPAAIAIPAEGYFEFQQGNYGPVFPRTPACYGFSILAKVKPGRENAIRDHGKAIEKAIQKSNLGLNPTVQGKVVRIFFPELSQERRQEFVKIIKKMSEDGRVAIRHVRRDAMDQLKKHGHDSGVTEDEGKHAEKELQKLTDQYIAKIDEHVAHKEKEIMTV